MAEGNETKKVVIKTIGKYAGHSIKANKSIDLTLKMGYDELPNYIKLIQLLNENINIVVKVGDEKPKELGMYMIKSIGIDHDGEGTIKFNSSLDYVEPDNLNGLAGEILKIAFKANVEVESEDEE